MFSKLALIGGLLALAKAQEPQTFQSDPPVSILSTVKDSVLPVLPTATPFTGLRTIEGAIVDKAPNAGGFIGLLGLASAQNNNPSATFVATLPTSAEYNPATGTIITGTVTISTSSNGTGVMVDVNLSNFPSVAQYGPFAYHIHGMPVPKNGDCSATMAHLDPTNRGEYYPYDKTNLASCQAGDLSGKHGTIMDTTFTASYPKPYLSTDPSSPYYFGDKSIIIYTSNTTRLTCANFMITNGSSSSSGAGSSTGPSTGAGISPSAIQVAGTMIG